VEGKKTFIEMFNKYISEETDEKIISSAFIDGMKFKSEAREFEFNIILSSIAELNIIEKISEKLKEAYNLNKVCITPKYSDNALNTQEVYSYILSVAKKQIPMVNGFLNGSEALFEDNKLIIKLKNKSSDLLLQSNLNSKLETLIFEQFSKKISVVFIDPNNDEFLEAYKENQQKQIKNISEKLPKSNSKTNGKGKNDIILGKLVKEKPCEIGQIDEYSGRVVVSGEVFNIFKKTTRNDKCILTFNITDTTGSITVKIFDDRKKTEPIFEKISNGMNVLVRGDAYIDRFENDTVITPFDIVRLEKTIELDNAEIKRVELHTHSNMSSMDAVTPVAKIIEKAAKWGHSAIAITDHGVAQAFPDAMNAAKKHNIKVLYGIESYFVNDTNPIVYGNLETDFNGEFIVFDIETTGLFANTEEITEIGAVLVKDGQIIDSFNTFVNPLKPIPEKITQLTGITDNDVKDAPKLSEALDMFYEFVGNRALVAHNAPFDISFIKEGAKKTNKKFNFTYIDTVPICRFCFPEMKSVKLNLVAEHIKLPKFNHHRATDDAVVLAKILFNLFNVLKEKSIQNISQINELIGNEGSKKDKSYHQIILVKNLIGLKNLYNLISSSHLKYFYKKPRIMKSQLMQFREGLILGSACEAGELYSAIKENKPWGELCDIAKFYDYLEIQPLANNNFLIESNVVESQENLKEFNKTIIKLGEKLNLPVVATGDVHFLDAKDEIFRRILMAGQGYEDADKQAPLYLKTTDEMLEEFSYLGEQKAYEVVVTNTNLIANLCEEIRPIPKESFPPEMEGAEEDLKKLTISRANEIYGQPLPEVVQERMDRELNSITKHGFSVMYMIAQKLVSKSLEEGYLVGSRGSVGSSLVAFLAGITEVNALSPHYICPNCKNSEFVVDGSFESGVDLPNKKCPICNTAYIKDGHDIPFETFLGFDGDKAPDIDLNFSGEYQAKAHKYTEELFGEGYVFRAGTISTIASKSAYGFVKKYFEEKNQILRKAEEQRLINGCSGIKKTTGQHPGGVMIVPKHKDIHDFTPVQRPADDQNSETITTHFDYHSIHDNLYKLDILGHDDPTVIRMLENLTGVDAKEIPLDDKDTMSIFTSTKALNLEEDNIINQVGSFAVPEFGTKFVREMLKETKPTTFAELVRISGLSHGTDVWINNTQELIKHKTATLKQAICTRDDIMLYLIHMGLPKKEAFNIMEKVRKGKGLSEENEQIMKEHNVPFWYINSCKKIQYMFPKAHAVAYVTMAFRIAYFKVHYPLAFYATYFTVRADSFDAAHMINGIEKVKYKMKEIEEKDNKKEASNKEKDMYTVLEVCYEMYKRGFEFLPIDLYKSDANKFLLVNNALLPPLNALQGLGVNAASAIANARGQGEFMSIEDIKIRAGATKTVIEVLASQGVLEGMDESSQMSLFN